MLLLEAKLSLKSSRQVTRSMDGQDRMQRSDSRSLGPGSTAASVSGRRVWKEMDSVKQVNASPAAGMIG